MRLRYRTVDVFTMRPFGGNPLAVVLDAADLSVARMQAIAREFNYAETTFVMPPRDPAHTAHVRIFTPAKEMPFAGHPNVGTACVLAQLPHHRHADAFTFEEAAGLVPIALIRDGDAVVGARITAPVPLRRMGPVPAALVARCLRLPETDIRTESHAPEIASVGAPFVIAELASRDALRRARPDMAAFEDLPRALVDAIYFYTRDVMLADGADIEARMFAPFDGIPEDPATGSATAAACALFTELEDRDQAVCFAQGTDMGRPSRLDATATRIDGGVRATVAGRCFPLMEGTITLPDDEA